MATTQNLYTGDGSTTNYSFTFEYLKQSDVKVTLDTVATTAFTFANATTLSFTTAPANGVAIRIFRDTAIDTLSSTFFPGSAIKAEDLNQNFTQSLYVTQESETDVGISDATANAAKTTAEGAVTTANSAVTTANSAVTTANNAVTTANSAVTTANTADTNASAAVTTANAASATATTASTDAASAVTTANTASTNASAAVTTANSAATDAATAITTANGAVTTANSATTAAAAAQTTANNAVTTANGAVTTANTASTNASAAVTTANTANTNASAAVVTANAAAASVSSAVLFELVANVAAIPGSPADQDYVEVADSTGIESFSPLSGVPAGFTGASGLTVRIRYDSSASSWVYMSYFANDSEDRYLTKNIPVVTGDSTNGSGQITLNCETNSHGIKIKGPPHSAAATYTLTLPNDAGSNGQSLTTNGSGTLTWTTQATDSISEGNTSAEVIDTGTDGRFVVTTEGSERLRVDSSGNVGIGTSTPNAKLHIHDGSGTNVQIVKIDSGGVGLLSIQSGATTDSRIEFGDSSNDDAGYIYYENDNEVMKFGVNAAERMRIDSSGKVGIGTSSPGYTLQVGTSGANVSIGGAPVTNGSGRLLFLNSNSVKNWKISTNDTTSGALEFTPSTSNGGTSFSAPSMIIDSAGRLLVGTSSTSGAAGLQVSQTNTYGEITLSSYFSVASVGLTAGDPLGKISFGSVIASGGGALTTYDAANIKCEADATASSSSDTPTRLTFSTTADGSSSPTERLRIDSSGRLLVGTSTARGNVDSPGGSTAPHVQFETVGNNYNNGLSIINNSTGTYAPVLTLGATNGGSIGSNTIVQNNQYYGTINFVGADGTNLIEGASIRGEVDGTPGANDMPGRLVFSTTADGASSPTRRMRIDKSGGTRIYSSTPYTLNVRTDAAAGGADYVLWASSAVTDILTGGSTVFAVYTNGNVQNTNNSYGALSDIKLKENIVDASSQWDDIKALRPVNYNFKEGQTHTQLGLIAQEVELVSPGLVTESPDRDEDGNDLGTVTKSVNYSVLYMKAVKALQEAMERIETLEQRLTDAGL